MRHVAKGAVYYIGGASAAGKTTASIRLAAAARVGRVELDDLQRAIMPALPDVSRRAVVTRQLARAAVTALLDSDAKCIIDGAWLEPLEAEHLRERYGQRFHPLYCGYRAGNIEARLSAIRSAGEHWLASISQTEAAQFLEKQVIDSETLKQTCEHIGIPYYDFTDPEVGFAALKTDFEQWLQNQR
jgi:predicted kinase